MRAALVAALLAAGAGPAGAQDWILQLVVAPLPSPYLSDWEADPAIGELIVTNMTATTTDVTFHYTLARGGRLVLRGTTDAHPIPAGESVTFNATSTFGGRADWDRSVQDQTARSGRLPEGEYEGCVTLVGPGGIVLAPRECARFTLQYPDPPFLVFPMNGDTVTTQDPIFEWQPVQLPPIADARIGYVLQLAEVRTDARQHPAVALESNILHYLEPDLLQTSHQYPVGAMPLVSGRTYAWRVQALDGDGRPVASNQGRSEIWTFVYREAESEVTTAVARIALESSRDTLRWAGDTSRVRARLYDADNVEIRGKRVAWSTLDSGIVKVDSAGVVTGVGAGETRIVATVDGVADSVLAVTADPGTLTVRLEPYDAATDKPGLLELIASGPMETVAPRLLEMLRSGEFRIPIPRLPSVEAALGSGGLPGGGTEPDDAATPGGPSAVDTRASSTAALGTRACNDVAFNVRDPYLDLERKVFVFYLPLNREQRREVTNCLGVPDDDGEVTEAERLRGAMFIASWKHPGVPRAILAVKGPGFGLTLEGPKVDVRYLVLNLTPALDLGADLLPPNLAGYFGDVSFEAGTGVTYYSRRRCDAAGADRPLCRLLSWISPENPFISIEAFAGVNASEVSAGSGTEVKGAGASLALGLTISASLPVRRWNTRVLGGSLDSTQVGLSFAAQDSLVDGAGAENGRHHRSINVAPTLKLWFTGGGGNSWEIDGSVAFEVDPDQPQDAVKLVVAAEVPTRWKFWLARLGNPTVVFTRKLEAEGEVELGLSGTWGVGPWNGNTSELVGIDEGDAGFEELGRGAVILKWAKPTVGPATRAQSRVDELQSRWRIDSTSAAIRLQALKQVCLADSIQARAAERSQSDPSLLGIYESARVRRDASCQLVTAEQMRQRADAQGHAAILAAYELADTHSPRAPIPGPPTCDGTLVFNDTRCFSWTARLSVGTLSLVDLLALIVRFATGAR